MFAACPLRWIGKFPFVSLMLEAIYNFCKTSEPLMEPHSKGMDRDLGTNMAIRAFRTGRMRRGKATRY
jgi:hypothetical protein